MFSYADDVVAMSLELPQADARVSGRSSVALVICQVRFDEQPSIDPAAAIEFHERLGGEAGPYPKIESVAGGGRILLQLGPSGPVQQQTTRETGWSL